MALSVDQFGKALVASGLMTADEVKAAWSEASTDARPKDGDAFAKLLVDRGSLTAFQGKQILAGRGATLVLGEYVVLQEIGAGGMGQVYKAQHKRMKRIVALKVMSSAAMKDEASVKRFQREVEAAARLEHPNIVTAYDAGRAGNVAFLVMQFVDGGDLSGMVKKHGPLPVERAVDYVVQAARGLAYAHSEGVIHRDIKPANLLCDKKGVVKILDMGLARLDKGEDGLTATEQVMGTVDYMSPEQASNTKTADARSDIYSLGCTLWYLLIGRRAYDGESMIERLMAHRERELPSLVKTRDDVPWPLEQAFHQMVAKRAADRFQTMDEVVAALEPFGSGSSKSSASGMGSSLGMSSGPHDKELSAFFKTVGPAAKSQTSKTAVPTDATEQFRKPEVDTDPKSEVLPSSRLAAGLAPRAAAKSQAKSKGPPLKLIAAGIGGLALVVGVAAFWLTRGGDKPGPVDTIAAVSRPASSGSPIDRSTPPVTPSPSSPLTRTTAPSFFAASSTPNAPVIPPPPGDYALLFDGNGIVEFDDPLPYTADSCTMEAFVRADASSNRASVFNLSERGELGFDVSDGFCWAVRHTQDASANSKSGGHYAARSTTPVEIGRRVHVAGVFDKTGYRLYVDGKMVGKTPPMDKRKFTLGTKRPSLGSLFQGVIDEVRISKTARYSADFTPAVRHEPDADTLALYHCDEGAGKVLVDSSSSKRNGRIVSAKWVQADGSPLPDMQAGAYVLDFDGISSRVDLPDVGLTLTKPLTVETWVFVRNFPANTSQHAYLVAGSSLHLTCEHEAHAWQFFGGNSSGASPKVRSDRAAEVGRWVHVAAVSDGAMRTLFVDGIKQKETVTNRPARDQSSNLTLGALLSAVNGAVGNFSGMLREVRISKVARYQADFPPAQRFAADTDTLALYHCDDGAGDVLADSSGRNMHGKITAAKWIRPVAGPLPPAVPSTAPSFTAALPAARWPLAPSKPEDIQRLLAAQAILTLRTGPQSETVVGSPDQIPAGPATVVGVKFRAELVPFDDAQLGVVAGLTDLEVLEQSKHGEAKFNFTAAGLLKLASLVQLRHLDLPKLASPAAVDIVRSMPQLTSVFLPYGTADEWARTVAMQPSVTEISAYRCNLTDEGLAHLAKMPQLKRLDLRDNSVTQAAVERFAAAVPGCRIEWGGNGVERQVIEPRTSNVAPAGDDWKTLFNGNDLSGWTALGTPGWRAEGGAIVGRTSGQPGWLATDVDYDHFELELEYKLGPGSNSGVFLRASPGGNLNGADFHEVQLLDDAATKFAKVSPDSKNGAIFKQLAPTANVPTPADQWHRLRVHCYGSHVRVAVDDVPVVDGELQAGKPPGGRIGLQLYPDRVYFRNLRVRPLQPDGSPVGATP